MSSTIRVRGAAGIVTLAVCALVAACGGSGDPPAIIHHQIQSGLSASPTAVSMGPSDTAAVNASEGGYSGTFGAQSSDTAIATVAPNGQAQFVITGVSPGTCTVTVSDTTGHSVQVSVSIQTTVIGGQ